MCKVIVNIFIILFFTLAVNAQNVIDAKGMKQGSWSKNDEQGRIKYKGQFKDNKPYGTFTYFHENGKVKIISNFFNDGEITRAVMFTYEGVKEAQGNFYNQKKDSIWIYFDASGKKILSQESYKSNLKDGTCINYSGSGTILEITNYAAGKKHGLWQVNLLDGKPKIVAYYNNGNIDSTYAAFYENGNKKIEGQYKNASRVGNWFFYDEKQELSKQEMYAEGKLKKTVYFNGTFKMFYSDDIPKEIFSYSKGKRTGAYVEYYNNGTLVKKNKTNDDGTQEIIEVFEGQTIKCKGEYLDDKKIGKFIYYKENGKVDKEENF